MTWQKFTILHELALPSNSLCRVFILLRCWTRTNFACHVSILNMHIYMHLFSTLYIKFTYLYNLIFICISLFFFYIFYCHSKTFVFFFSLHSWLSISLTYHLYLINIKNHLIGIKKFTSNHPTLTGLVLTGANVPFPKERGWGSDTQIHPHPHPISLILLC